MRYPYAAAALPPVQQRVCKYLVLKPLGFAQYSNIPTLRILTNRDWVRDLKMEMG